VLTFKPMTQIFIFNRVEYSSRNEPNAKNEFLVNLMNWCEIFEQIMREMKDWLNGRLAVVRSIKSFDLSSCHMKWEDGLDGFVGEK